MFSPYYFFFFFVRHDYYMCISIFVFNCKGTVFKSTCLCVTFTWVYYDRTVEVIQCFTPALISADYKLILLLAKPFIRHVTVLALYPWHWTSLCFIIMSWDNTAKDQLSRENTEKWANCWQNTARWMKDVSQLILIDN